ncbi:MAG: CYTH domain-containing protein [Gammaproteobacteria bacterium]|nr:CYTH domain-containing protein [Gammaproteobacteria bacterium]
MAQEIERKFLIKNDDWRANADSGVEMVQGYLQSGEKSSIRVRLTGDKAWLNIKSATLSISRSEYEYTIPLADAKEILLSLCGQSLINKTRYHVDIGHHTWEVDVFAGDNLGLIVAEIELSAENEAFEMPAWAGEEVSHDARYYNVCLAKQPYKDWS